MLQKYHAKFRFYQDSINMDYFLDQGSCNFFLSVTLLKNLTESTSGFIFFLKFGIELRRMSWMTHKLQ